MPSKRVQAIVPFLAMDVMARAKQMEREGIDIVHFEVGEPDFATPEVVKQAAVRAICDDATHYTVARGDHELVAAIVAQYKQRYGVTIQDEQVIVSAGSSPLLLMAFMAALDPGDEIIIPRPYYPCYRNFSTLAGAVAVYVDALPEDGFRVRPEAIRAAITPRTKVILLNSPSNPTGAVLDGAALKEIASFGVLVLSDEIYHGLTYEGEEHSMLEYTTNCFVMNGFSKAFSMTGWRLGYAVVPKDYVRIMEILQQNIIISANSFAQRGAIVALCEETVPGEAKRMKDAYDERRRVLVAGLRDAGFRVPVPPTGAFYILADARHISTDTMALSADLLQRARVGVTPGEDFGAPGFFRFSYTIGMDRIEEGIRRLKAALQ